MNRDRLRKVFDNYIKKFELINNPECNENYKWRVAKDFHDLMDPALPSFASRLKEAWKLSENLIDSSNRYCFSALVSCAIEHKAEEEVRQLFIDLFADDGGDLTRRQQKILTFIESSNALIARLHSTNNMFMNDQRSAMGYLFLYDPDKHYLYKASEANSFASCVEFYDDWGSGTNFKLDLFYRMCDMIVAEIRQFQALVDTHNSRFFDKDGNPVDDMHPDTNYHILVFDIIYGAPEFRYNFYEGIPFPNITAQARKLHVERTEKAQMLYDDLVKAQERATLLKEAQDYFASILYTGMEVKHRIFGVGEIRSLGDVYDNTSTMTVFFPKKNEEKSFQIMLSFAGGFITAEIEGMAEKVTLYRSVINSQSNIKSSLLSAQKALEPYKDFLS